MTGQPFGMFDYTPVGLALVVVGNPLPSLSPTPLIPKDRRAAPTMGEALNIEGYTTEASVAPGSAAIGKDAPAWSRERRRGRGGPHQRDRRSVSRATPLAEGDTILLKGDPEALERAYRGQRTGAAGPAPRAGRRERGRGCRVIEAVVTGESVLVAAPRARSACTTPTA